MIDLDDINLRAAPGPKRYKSAKTRNAMIRGFKKREVASQERGKANLNARRPSKRPISLHKVNLPE